MSKLICFITNLRYQGFGFIRLIDDSDSDDDISGLHIDVPDTLPAKNICNLANPFIGNPFGAEEHRTASVEHSHVRAATPLDVVPEHG